MTERVTYVPCTRCANSQVMAPLNIEEDPVCMTCLRELAKIAADKTYEKKECPGWGEECGNEIRETNDLCPDCTMGRMNSQSPRVYW